MLYSLILENEIGQQINLSQTAMDDTAKAEHKKRIRELRAFIRSQPCEITEFEESLVKKMLERVTVHDDHLEFRFKSGVAVSVEM